MKDQPYTLTQSQLEKAVWLWMQGRDTAEIAFNLGVHQSAVANQLETIKAEANLVRARAA